MGRAGDTGDDLRRYIEPFFSQPRNQGGVLMAKKKVKAKAKDKVTASVRTRAKAKSKALPARMNTLSPHLVCAGAADAIKFYKKAFGAVEMMRLPGRDGKLAHAAVAINGASVMLVDEFPEMCNTSPATLKGTPVTLHLVVDDVDAFTARAIKAGAKVIMPAADMFWGDRYGVIEDPFGHRWSIATHLRDMSVQEIRKAMRGAMPFQ
jgi:uncharacterized glyoxalase superfamily protein PhnB